MSNEDTRQTNKSVGSITMVNMTGNEVEVWVNSDRTSHIIPRMTSDLTDYRETDPSPVNANGDGAKGFNPTTMVFLRTIEQRASYFHNNSIESDDENVEKIDIGGREVTYGFKITGAGNQVLKNSGVMTINRSSITISAPDGDI